MPSENDIIEAMQMSFFYDAEPINETGSAAFTITYQFESSAPADDFSGLTGWSAWDTTEMLALRAAFALIETFLNVDFVEVSGDPDADLSLGLTTMPTGQAGLGGASLATWSDGSFYDYDSFAAYDKTLDITTNPSLILHELGHSLGLSHPFEGYMTLSSEYDSTHYTLMSYTTDRQSGEDNDTMMLFDVLALQDIWGAAEYNTGNTTYTGPRTTNVDTIWDTGGIDTFDASARYHAVQLDLRDGEYSTFGDFEDVSIAFGVTIENAIGGAGGDSITGNSADNVLQGKGDIDEIRGKIGKDTILGGNGDDLLMGGNGQDTIKGGSGADEIQGGNAKDTLKGGSGADQIHGDDGDDWLRGGSGYDRLWGDEGEDTFYFTAGADKDVIKDFESGVDTLVIDGLGAHSNVLARAEEEGGHVTFDFGGGDLLVVKNMTLDALENDLLVS